MEGVGSASGGDADDGSGGLAVLGAVAVGEHLELGDGLDGGIDEDGAIGSYVVVVRAIDEEEIVRGRIAVDREVDATLKAFIFAIEVVGAGDAGRELREFHEAASVQWELFNLGAVDDRAERSAVGLDLDGVGFNRDDL